MKKSIKRKVAIRVGAGMLAAAALGSALLFAGKRGAKNRKKIGAWTSKAKKEVVAQVKRLKKINKPLYHKVVDRVTAHYKKIKKIDPKEIAAVAGELKKHWEKISRELGGARRRKTATRKRR